MFRTCHTSGLMSLVLKSTILAASLTDERALATVYNSLSAVLYIRIGSSSHTVVAICIASTRDRPYISLVQPLDLY